MKTLGDRIKEARLKKGLTQVELAELAGMKQQTLHDLESGKSKKTFSIVQLANALDVSPEWLLQGKGKEPHKKKDNE